MRHRGGENGLRRGFLGVCAIFLWLGALQLCGCAPGQEAVFRCFYMNQSMQRSLPVCETYTLSVRAKEGGRLDLYFRIPYSHLHFEKDLDEFKGSYSASIIIRDEKGTVVQTKDVDRALLAKTYGESVSSSRDAFLQTFLLPTGPYAIEIFVTDNKSGLKYRHRQPGAVRDFQKEPLAVSDYLFFEKGQPGQKTISLRPLFPTDFSFLKDSLGIFQELYDLRSGDTISVSMSYSAARRDDDGRGTSISPYQPYRVKLRQCTRPLDSTYFESDTIIVIPRQGNLQVLQYYPRLSVGVSAITRKVFLHRESSFDSTVSRRIVFSYPSSFPRLASLDDEIAAMSYIARPSEAESLRAGTTSGDRVERLNRFWAEHGGDAKMRAYQERVEEANSLFSSCVEGWKTPMGITYIVCGPPDIVDCQGGIDETWYYDMGGNRAFAVPFRLNPGDEFGRYYEVIPFSLNDYFWGQFVDRWRSM